MEDVTDVRESRIYIGGTFDLLHSGHIELFRRASKHGKVVVSLNKDEFAARYKRKPVMPLNERFAVIEAIKYVDEVMINSGDEDSKPAILEARATHILHGDDWTGESLMKQMDLTEKWLKEHDIEMYYLPYTPHVSSSKIYEAI